MKITKTVRNLNGYIVLYRPEHPWTMKSENWNGWVYEHIYVIQSELGRKLSKSEAVHHLDFNRSNNTRSNLCLLSQADHARLHAWIDRGCPVFDSSAEDYVTQTLDKNKNVVKHSFSCKSCGKTLQKSTKTYCNAQCAGLACRRAPRPSKDKLERLIVKYTWTAIGKHYGVSDNAVRKWARALGIID